MIDRRIIWPNMKPTQIIATFSDLSTAYRDGDSITKNRVKANVEDGINHIQKKLEALTNYKWRYHDIESNKQLQDLVSFEAQLRLFDHLLPLSIWKSFDNAKVQMRSADNKIERHLKASNSLCRQNNKKLNSTFFPALEQPCTDSKITTSELISTLKKINQDGPLPLVDMRFLQAYVGKVVSNCPKDHENYALVQVISQQLRTKQNHTKLTESECSSKTGPRQRLSQSVVLKFNNSNGIARTITDLQAEVTHHGHSGQQPKKIQKRLRKCVPLFRWHRGSLVRANNVQHRFSGQIYLTQFGDTQYQFETTPPKLAAAIANRIINNHQWKKLIAWGDNVFITELKAKCDKKNIELVVLNQKLLELVTNKTEQQRFASDAKTVKNVSMIETTTLTARTLLGTVQLPNKADSTSPELLSEQVI